jgi:hypothetical protein
MNIYQNFVAESRGLTQQARPWESNPLNEIMVLEGMGNAIQDMMDRVDGMVDAYESYKTSPSDKQLKKNLYSSYKHASMEMYGRAPELHVSEEGFFNKAIEMLSNVIGAIIRFIGSIVSWLTGGGSGGGGSGGGSVVKDFKEAQRDLLLEDFSKYVNTFTPDQLSGFVSTHRKVFELTIYEKDALFKMARYASEHSVNIVRLAMEEMLRLTVDSGAAGGALRGNVVNVAQKLLCEAHSNGLLLTVDKFESEVMKGGVTPTVTKDINSHHIYETNNSDISCKLTLKGVSVKMPDCSALITGGTRKKEELLLFSGVGFTYVIQSDKYPKSADEVVKFMQEAKSMRSNFVGSSEYIASLKKVSATLERVDKMLGGSANGHFPQILTFYRNIIKSSNEVIAMGIKIRKEEYSAMSSFISAVMNMVKKGNALPNP